MFEHDPTMPSELGLNPARLEAIPDYFEERYLKTGKLSCMALLISRGGEIAHESYRGTERLNGAVCGAPTRCRRERHFARFVCKAFRHRGVRACR